MKPSRRRTLQLKTAQCQYCKLADKRALRMNRAYCKVKNPTITNGHCERFDAAKLKKSNGKTTRDKKREKAKE